MGLHFRLLGRFGVQSDDEEIGLGRPKQRAVLAVLLLHANEIVPTDRIIDLVWGEHPPRTAEHSVQIYISELRKALSRDSSAELIDTRSPGYVINVSPDSVDMLRFERLVREGLSLLRSGDPARGRLKLTEALSAWSGAPLAEFAYEDFAQGHIRSLTELRSDALEALATLALDQGDPASARDLASSAVEANPLREQPHRIMMLGLYRSGRHAEALRHFAEYQNLLAEELGIEPSESLRDLEERILFQDPSLDVTPRSGADGNPYRGLRYFSEDDADVYFGRESLVAEVLDRLAVGTGFVSIVGPSGSGKSSVARAGVTPALRDRGETVVVLQPGSRPLWELAGSCDEAGLGHRATLLRRFENDPESLREVVSRPLVLVIDQFEELFTLADPDAAVRFSELISTAVHHDPTALRVVTTLRADYYDRPLSIPALAGVFSDSVVTVKPMTPQEIERAVIEPARAAGVMVEPALLAQLVADMGDEPGALPLLQFTLFELFERTSKGLTLADYERIGGINGALTRGADEQLADLDPESRDLAEQLMMRMVQKGRAAITARPVPLRDLVDLVEDSVTLQGVLEAFAARRLITFDRDASGVAVVEMAHEFLISRWPQMESWLDEHSDDLERLYALEIATQEWVQADHSDDYLLRGDRLDRFEVWAAAASLRLTKRESKYLGASVAFRRDEESRRQQQLTKEESLRRSARRRLWAFGAAVAGLVAAVTLLVLALVPDSPPDAILWSETGTNLGRQIGDGFDRAIDELGLTGVHFVDSPAYLTDVETYIERGSHLVMMHPSLLSEEEVMAIIETHPEVQFVHLDCDARLAAEIDTSPNETCIVARHDEVGFLAGVVAAHMSEARHVGIVVGVDLDWMRPFHTGFEDGVAYVDPDVRVSSVYLTNDFDWSGFASDTFAFLATSQLISEGADVIFSAAGDSYIGVLESAVVNSQACCLERNLGRASESAARAHRKVWTVAADSDWYQVMMDEFGDEEASQFIASSIVKHFEIGIAETIREFFNTGSVDTFSLDIANGGIDYVTTGGFIDDHVAALEAAKHAVVRGTVQLSTGSPSQIRYATDLLQD